jgi:hypothetical protein
MKNKSVIIAGLVVLVVLLVISVITVNKPQQTGTKAQTVDAVLQCQNDGGSVTDQASCTGSGRQVLNTIGDTSVGGDTSTVQVCCKITTVNTPVPPPSCPAGKIEKPEAECPSGSIVTPIGSTANGGDNKYIQPGIVCCRPDVPTPTTPTTGNPTPTTCPLPDVPTIRITNVSVACPGDCAVTTQ